MKLIDLLVQELPKRGGWPEGAGSCAYGIVGDSAKVHFAKGMLGMSGHIYPSIFSAHGASDDCLWITHTAVIDEKPEDSLVITREQYEAALAASQQPAWNGEGVPPVGIECEFKSGYVDGESYSRCKVIAHFQSENSVCAAYIFKQHDGTVLVGQGTEKAFRPIRTEAERKSEAISGLIEYIFYTLGEGGNYLRGKGVYEAIAAGKIPGVKLEG